MKAKFLVLAPFCIIIALVFIITCVPEQPQTTHSTGQYARASTTNILNQNKLNVIFPGQNLIIRTENDSNQRICYAIYEDAWLPKRHGKIQEGMCYDLERNTAGICDSESDLEIKDGKITPLNGALMLVFDPQDFNNEFLCSNTVPHTFYDGYKEEMCCNMHNPEECYNAVGVDVYRDIQITYSVTFTRHACIITGMGNYFKYKIENYEIEQKQERIPSDMTCTEIDDGSIVVETSALENGVHYIAYVSETPSGKREKTRTYTFVKTDVPYPSISNPNFDSIIYPENKEEMHEFYIFNEFLISAEYTEDLTAIWYRCDDGEWYRTEVEGRFAHVRVDESLCKTAGKHTVFYFAESSDINGTVNKYHFFQNTERPRLESLEIITEKAGTLYRLGMEAAVRSLLPQIPLTINWYEDGIFRGSEETISVPGGSKITVQYTPIDITRLKGTPINTTITTPNEPPETRDINISVYFKYPPVILATGDYHDPDSTPEGKSIYKWYRDGTFLGEGRELTLNPYPSGGIEIEYTPVDAAGLAGTPITKTISVSDYIMDYWLYLYALYHSNTTHCERIRNASLRSECLDTVGLSIQECSDRPQREKFFCLAFLTGNTEYCRYIEIEWYRLNCLAFIGGSPEECMTLGEGRDQCILQFASSTGNPELCTSVTDMDTKKLCIALAKKNPDLCSSISDPYMKETCSSDASYR
jgi:hypothetical protein